MKQKQTRENSQRAVLPVEDRLSFLWLGVAFVILFFSNGLRIVPIAAWAGPLFLVRFLRTQKPVRGLLVGYLVNAVLFFFQWQSAFQDAGPMFTLYTAVFGLIVFLPYAADRLLRPHVRGFAATLVLPVTWVVCEYVLHLILPLGTFFSMAYTQHGNLPLLQLMSVTGLWGVTFVVLWAAGVANYAWEGDFEVRRIGRGVAAYGIFVLVVLLGGGVRMVISPPTADTVRVSVLTTDVEREVIPEWGDEQERRLVEGRLTDADRQDLGALIAEINDDLMGRSRAEAQAGSRIVVWTEYDAHVFKDEEDAFLDQISELAREEQIYMAIPLITLTTDPTLYPEPGKPVENALVLVTPEGEIAYQYTKANLLIGWEAEYAIRGPREIQTVDTPYGRLAGAICLDMDYPDFMRQAGQKDVDIVLGGAIDGTQASKGNPLHSVMASYRAIESGMSMARAGKYAQNLAVDYQGRTLASANYYTADGRTLVAHVPTKGTATIYARLGDFFPWLCMLCLVGFAGHSILRTRKLGGRRLGWMH
jgi:apolipoprotein N-acyltransferase